VTQLDTHTHSRTHRLALPNELPARRISRYHTKLNKQKNSIRLSGFKPPIPRKTTHAELQTELFSYRDQSSQSSVTQRNVWLQSTEII
jgi:hypothetical protein